jgi:hypothetical protein
VILPPRVDGGDSRLFFGRLSGHTVVYPFSSCARFEMDFSAGAGVLQPLADSRLFPNGRVVRAHATHGKSKTDRRTDFFPHDNTA